MINLPELRANDIKNELNNIVKKDVAKALPKVEGYKKLFAQMMHKKQEAQKKNTKQGKEPAQGKYIQLKLDLKKEITGFLSFKKIKDFVDQYVKQKREELNAFVDESVKDKRDELNFLNSFNIEPVDKETRKKRLDEEKQNKFLQNDQKALDYNLKVLEKNRKSREGFEK
jgi:hypothetical protein